MKGIQNKRYIIFYRETPIISIMLSNGNLIMSNWDRIKYPKYNCYKIQ